MDSFFAAAIIAGACFVSFLALALCKSSARSDREMERILEEIGEGK